MQRPSTLCGLSAALLLAAAWMAPAALGAQEVPSASRDDIASLARVEASIAKVRDSMHAQMAMVRNKTPNAQRELQEKLRELVEEVLHHTGMTTEKYQRLTFLVSIDSANRVMFDSAFAVATGAPLPGRVVAAGRGGGAGAGTPPVNLPPGQAGTHVGHVVTSFTDTPNRAGLLPTALAEARIAAQHANLGSRQPENLEYMKTHTGHVMHALDPSVETSGPGQGYGVKKAALGVISHIELAAKAEGAPQNVITHSVHIATAAKNTAQWADEALEIAKQIRAATSASDAAALMRTLVTLTEQLTAGVDANGDGRITWQEGEGGLQQSQEHVNLMLGSG